MKKQLFSALLLGSLVTTAGVFVGCKDYDDDISSLQQMIDRNSDAIAKLQELINKGSVITNVAKSENGVVVTLSDGKTFELTNGANGADGAPGTVWTISEDGYWVKDGVKTGYKALGEKGDKGDKGDQGEKGETGAQGPQGEAGAPGAAGAQGEAGAQGAQGPQGEVGPQGPQGEQGPAGANGENGKDGADGKYYVPNASTGCFDIYDPSTGATTATDISFRAPNAVTAVKSEKAITFYGISGTGAEGVSISLEAFLSSMVFMPSVYLDGIEATKYTYVQAAVQNKTTHQVTFPHRENANGAAQKTVKLTQHYKDDTSADNTQLNGGEYEYVPSKTYWFYSPAQVINYHVNPANAQIEASDIQGTGFNVLNPDILETKTRAFNMSTDVRAVEKGGFIGGETDLIKENYSNRNYSYVKFGNKDGVLNIGLRIINAKDMLAYYPTSKELTDVNTNGYVAALQLKSKNPETPIVTSDYALLLPVKREVVALQWYKEPMYRGDAVTATGATGRKGDIVAECHGTDKIHLYDTPEGALQDPAGAALEISWDEKDFDLTQYLGICFKEEVYEQYYSTDASKKVKYGVLKYGAETPYGLYYDFEKVNYTLDGNVTCESDYIRESAEKQGHYSARNVEANKSNGNAKQVEEQSETEVDREPLIRVLVKAATYNSSKHEWEKTANDQVVLEGYVLFHITRELSNVAIDKYPKGGVPFDPCKNVTLMSTTWSQFNDYVLTQTLGNMTKAAFDAEYEPDLVPGSETGERNRDGVMKMFTVSNVADLAKGDHATQVTVDPTTFRTQYGVITHADDVEGTTNNDLVWNMTNYEYEKLTHHSSPKNVEVYVRYKAKNPTSASHTKYNFIYVKLGVELTRNKNSKSDWGKKNINYWYGMANKDDEGLDVWHLDVEAPRNDTYMRGSDGSTSVDLEHELVDVLVGNQKSKATAKYYFLPTQDQLTIAGYEIVTDYDTYKCYFNYDSHKYSHADMLKNITDNTCVLAYGDQFYNNVAFNTNPFDNDKLYAKKNGTKTLIATLNQSTGKVTLLPNAVSKELLNAFDYNTYRNTEATKTFSAWIGVIDVKCETAMPLNDDVFLAGWQRPINLDGVADQPAIDGRNNENVIYLTDIFNFHDWRGEDFGFKKPENMWFMVYYGVKGLTIDFANITTDMHNGNLNSTKLTSISKKVRVMAYENNQPLQATMNGTKKFDLFWNDIKNMNASYKNQDLLDYIEAVDPVTGYFVNKDKFGAIYYENNGENVTKFSILVPVTVEYFWGTFQTKVRIDIDRTTGN